MPDLDTCQPGDPMPPDNDRPGLCANTATVDGQPFVCTRGPDHGRGQHVASGPVGLGSIRRVLATWTDTSDLVRVWNGP
jgi:hypothetical protein